MLPFVMVSGIPTCFMCIIGVLPTCCKQCCIAITHASGIDCHALLPVVVVLDAISIGLSQTPHTLTQACLSIVKVCVDMHSQSPLALLAGEDC